MSWEDDFRRNIARTRQKIMEIAPEMLDPNAFKVLPKDLPPPTTMHASSIQWRGFCFERSDGIDPPSHMQTEYGYATGESLEAALTNISSEKVECVAHTDPHRGRGSKTQTPATGALWPEMRLHATTRETAVGRGPSPVSPAAHYTEGTSHQSGGGSGKLIFETFTGKVVKPPPSICQLFAPPMPFTVFAAIGQCVPIRHPYQVWRNAILEAYSHAYIYAYNALAVLAWVRSLNTWSKRREMWDQAWLIGFSDMKSPNLRKHFGTYSDSKLDQVFLHLKSRVVALRYCKTPHTPNHGHIFLTCNWTSEVRWGNMAFRKSIEDSNSNRAATRFQTHGIGTATIYMSPGWPVRDLQERIYSLWHEFGHACNLNSPGTGAGHQCHELCLPLKGNGCGSKGDCNDAAGCRVVVAQGLDAVRNLGCYDYWLINVMQALVTDPYCMSRVHPGDISKVF
jgi:hypothetical protein